MSELDEVLSEFLVESYENLDQLDQDLLALEEDPTSRDTLASVFRTIHTIKGTCGFLGFGTLESVAHAGENLLRLLRDGDLVLTEEITSALLATVDAVREMLGAIEATGSDGDEDYSALVGTLKRLQQPPAVPATSATAAPGGVATGEQPAEPRLMGEILVERGATTSEEVTFAAHEQELGDPRRIGEILVGQAGVRPTDVVEALQAQGAARESRESSVADGSIRVDVGLLDNLMNLVGELVLARNQIVQLTTAHQENEFVGASQRLNLITTELQEGVMKTRMQPIGNVWSKFPRVVRDLSVTCGKQVRVEMEGKDTELDKTIIEAIKDPLTHLVRNSVDHGVETAEERVAKGKPAEGLLLLRAYHEGGQVNIEIFDDGAGINAEKVKAKAVDRGLVTAEQAARMGEREATNLIFLAGFSTAEKITNVSGRGVGMDVVKTNIEKIGGTVDVSTELGRGTTFKVKIPLTLAIIPALVVTTAGDRYAIPQISLLELVRLEGEQARRSIEMIHGAPVYRLRGRLLPVVYLDAELGLAGGRRQQREVVNIVVLQTDGQQFGLVVDDINDTQEIVVKPLGSQVKDVPAFAGATIMGDGRVALILDVLGIAQRAKVVSEARDRAPREAAEQAVDRDGERRTLLLLGVGQDRRMAIPLEAVSRLEEFPATAVEYAGGRDVVQYRGEILPLVHLADALGVPAAYDLDPNEPLNVVVHAHGDRNVGLVVGRILDIVEERLTLERRTDRPGLVGSAVIQQHVTDVLDIAEVVRSVDPARFSTDFPTNLLGV